MSELGRDGLTVSIKFNKQLDLCALVSWLTLSIGSHLGFHRRRRRLNCRPVCHPTQDPQEAAQSGRLCPWPGSSLSCWICVNIHGEVFSRVFLDSRSRFGRASLRSGHDSILPFRGCRCTTLLDRRISRQKCLPPLLPLSVQYWRDFHAHLVGSQRVHGSDFLD